MKPEKSSRAGRQRPPLVRLPDEMRRIFAMLADELATFPEITTRPMFGFTGFYRRGTIFAAIPRSRAIGSPSSLIFKLNAAPERVFARLKRDQRITPSEKGMTGWHSFEISAEQDIAAAQQWLAEAWRWAKKD